jgi:hypothetical protein
MQTDSTDHWRHATPCALHHGRRGSFAGAAILALAFTTLLAGAPSYATDDPLVGTWQSVDNPRWKLTISRPAGQPNKLKLEGAYPHCDDITTTGSKTTEASTNCTGMARKCPFTDHPSLKVEGDKLIFTYNMLSIEDDGTCKIAHQEQATSTFRLVSRPGETVPSK